MTPHAPSKEAFRWPTTQRLNRASTISAIQRGFSEPDQEDHCYVAAISLPLIDRSSLNVERLHQSGPHVAEKDRVYFFDNISGDFEELPFVFDWHQHLAGAVVEGHL